MDHFVEQAFIRLGTALKLCQQSKPVDRRVVDWLFADADFAVQSLSRNGSGHTPTQRAKLLELLLCLANLQEYLGHHSLGEKVAD